MRASASENCVPCEIASLASASTSCQCRFVLASRDHLQPVGERNAGRHERSHLPREVHDLGPLDALLRDLDREQALARPLDLLNLEVAFEKFVARERLAERVDLVFDLGAVGGDGGIAES